ncbi:MAG: hypothetical protein EXS16_21235 [Gemmataceae bacterium]|nr:hypothetical protein [Gemmataceae bacterium]
MSAQAKPAGYASPRQVLLGLFILFQLAFLIVNNFLDFVKWAPTEMKGESKKAINRIVPGFAEEQGHTWQWAEQVETNVRRWVQLTGQDQAWALFAPTVGTSTGFPTVVLLWDDPADDDTRLPGNFVTFDERNGFNFCGLWDRPGETPSLRTHGMLGALAANSPWERLAFEATHIDRTAATPKLLLSPNEPTDISNYLRVGNCRVRRYDGQFYFNPQPYSKYDQPKNDPEPPATLAERMSRRTKRLLTDYHDPALEYLRWRLRAWEAENPGQPKPKQVLLMQRFYRIHGPTESRGWDGPYTLPIARWQPETRIVSLANKLEPFDFTQHRFVLP